MNRGYRVQFNNAIGPYKGGLRFHPQRQPEHPQVPRLRADLQEQPDHPAHGRRQGRLRFRPQGQVRQRGHAFLPGVHDWNSAATSARTPTFRPAISAWAAARSAIMLRPCTRSSRNEYHRRAHRQGPELGRQPHPPGSHRLRRGLFRRGNAARPATCDFKGKTVCRSPVPATWPSTPHEKPPNWAARS
ncbi:MAG: hypothetical protein MZV64_04130 [Ignavibacteriales bacterium]|nr:hypothetical protein [Ignavibacteriales bacterium]